MSKPKKRPSQVTRKKFLVFCEGDTEYNYIKFMNRNQGVEISLMPINLHGGGYKNCLDELKKNPETNSMARFVILDADLAFYNKSELKNLKELYTYCENINKRSASPIILILSQLDFEFTACNHSTKFKDKPIDTTKFIQSEFNFKSLDDFKSNKDIYTTLNKDKCSFKNLDDKHLLASCIIKNDYKTTKSNYSVKNCLNADWDNLCRKATNFIDFFNIIDW